MKTIKILTTLSQFYTEIVDFHWVHIRSLNSWSTVNQYYDHWSRGNAALCFGALWFPWQQIAPIGLR